MSPSQIFCPALCATCKSKDAGFNSRAKRHRRIYTQNEAEKMQRIQNRLVVQADRKGEVTLRGHFCHIKPTNGTSLREVSLHVYLY